MIAFSLANFKIDLDILRNKMNIQLKISSENNEEINNIYEAWRTFSEIISDDIIGDPVDNIKDKLNEEMEKIVQGIYQIVNIIVRSKIRYKWKRVKEPLIQKDNQET